MLKYVLIILATLLILTVTFLGFQGQKSTQPPLVVFDDMVWQPKYKNQGASDFFPDARQMRMPPGGTIPWGRDAKTPDPALRIDDTAMYELKKVPVPVDMALLNRGQALFTTYCTVCHGAFGNGAGITTKYGIAPPANYHTDRLRKATDGYLYQVITEGKGLMGAYGPSVKPQDRWAVVAYVRALQLAGNATIEDVPQAQRAELLKAK